MKQIKTAVLVALLTIGTAAQDKTNWWKYATGCDDFSWTYKDTDEVVNSSMTEFDMELWETRLLVCEGDKDQAKRAIYSAEAILVCNAKARRFDDFLKRHKDI